MSKEASKTRNMKEAIENDTVFNGEREVSVADIRKFIPAEFFVKKESRFFISVAFSLSLTLVVAFLAHTYLPLTWAALPLWLIYAAVEGTIATGIWVKFRFI